MPRKKKAQVAGVIQTGDSLQVILPEDREFALVAAHLQPFLQRIAAPNIGTALEQSEWTLHDVLSGSPALRRFLQPRRSSVLETLQRCMYYAERDPLVSRALDLRASLNASEFRIYSPDSKAQAWAEETVRRLNLYSFVRELFWRLRAFDQAVYLEVMASPTGEGARTPAAVRCIDFQIARPEGSKSDIFVYPANDPQLVEKANNPKLRKTLHPLILQAIQSGSGIPAKALEEAGMYFGYVSRTDHRPGLELPSMYAIMPDLELISMAADIDANVLFQMKAGIMLIRVGPENPTQAALIPKRDTLREIEAELRRQIQNRLPSLFARGDVRIEWLVPPTAMFSPEKYERILERVFNWLGLPRIVWPVQPSSGSFAEAYLAIRILREECRADRVIVKQVVESLLERAYRRATLGDARFEVSFDASTLVDDNVLVNLLRLYHTYGGPSMETLMDVSPLDLSIEVERERRRREMESGEYWGPYFVPSTGRGAQPGRPPTVSEPTQETPGMRVPRS